jgi:hypothetical protein
MKKIASFLLTAFAASTLFAFPIYAEETSGPASKTLSPEVVSCTQSAIESRDATIIAAVDTYATAVKMALSIRKDALKAAWAKAIPAEIRAALKTAWAGYKKSLSAARKGLKDNKAKAWKQFNTERKACKGGDTVETANPQVDSAL